MTKDVFNLFVCLLGLYYSILVSTESQSKSQSVLIPSSTPLSSILSHFKINFLIHKNGILENFYSSLKSRDGGGGTGVVRVSRLKLDETRHTCRRYDPRHQTDGCGVSVGPLKLR